MLREYSQKEYGSLCESSNGDSESLSVLCEVREERAIPGEIWPEGLVFPGSIESAQMVTFFCRRLDIMDIQPLQ
jgi:hypothetical protein